MQEAIGGWGVIRLLVLEPSWLLLRLRGQLGGVALPEQDRTS